MKKYRCLLKGCESYKVVIETHTNHNLEFRLYDNRKLCTIYVNNEFNIKRQVELGRIEEIKTFDFGVLGELTIDEVKILWHRLNLNDIHFRESYGGSEYANIAETGVKVSNLWKKLENILDTNK